MPPAERPPQERDTVLGVERSLTGKRWEARLADLRLAQALCQQLDVPELVGRVLAGRGVAPEAAELFLKPTLRDQLPDPSHLLDLDNAVARLETAIRGRETVAVFGDYDVDGATSAALLQRFFRAIGQDLTVYIPDRLSEGYGPNGPALQRLRDAGVSLVVTLDCGTTAFEALETAAAAGLQVLVVDHHAADSRLPRAQAVVNPNRLDETSPHGHLAAIGVTFLLVVGLNRTLRQSGWYGEAGRREPDLRGWLDLVALGTVCDVVPLTGANRALVAQGLKVLAERRNVGLAALADVAGIDERPGAFHCGYVLGPRVNAGGRVGEASLGARLLATEDKVEGRQIAEQLDRFNAERRDIENQVLDQALAQVERQPAQDRRGLIVAAGAGWHAGVIGIVASRLKERYNLPALVIALDQGVGKGSGRSVPGVDLGAQVIAARQAGLLVNGGGHAMAAGLTVAQSALPALRAFLVDRLAARIEAIGYCPSLGLDGALQPGAASFEMLEHLQRIGPYGVGNPEPRFVLPAVRIQRPQVVGEQHVRCQLLGSDGRRLKGIAFRGLDSALGEGLLKAGALPLHVAGKLRADSWSGPDAVQFIIEDAAPVNG